MDDGLWFDRVDDVATIEKVRLWGPPKWKEDSPTAIGAGNPVKFWAYVSSPRLRPQGEDASAGLPPRRRAQRLLDLLHAHPARNARSGLRGDRAGVPRQHGLRPRRVREHRLRRPRGRRQPRLPRLHARELPLHRQETGGHGRLEPRRPHQPDEHLRPPGRLCLRLRRRTGQRPHRAPRLPGRRLPRPLPGRPPHRTGRLREHRGIQAPLAGWNAEKLQTPCWCSPTPTTRT